MAIDINGPDGGPDGGPDEPPETDQDGTARLTTTAGEAAAEVVLDQQLLHPDERLAFRLVNRGQVELTTGRAFGVERWNGHRWILVPEPNTEGFVAAFTDEGWLLGPGDSTQTQSWPFPGIAVETGWYRIVKSARFEGSQHGAPDQELVARSQFRVGSDSYRTPADRGHG